MLWYKQKNYSLLNHIKVVILRVGEESLPQVEEFKDLGLLFMSEGKMEWEIDGQIGAASAIV